MKGRKLSLASLALGCLVFATGIFLLARVKPLVVGTSAGFPPFEMLEKGPKGEAVVGFDVDLAKAIGQKLKRPAKIVNLPLKELIPALEKGEVELVLSAVKITGENAERTDFSVPYYRATSVVLMREGEEEPASLEEMAGKKIGAPEGTVYYEMAKGITGQDNLVPVPTPQAGMQYLLNSQVDFVVVESQPVAVLQKLYPEARLTKMAFPEVRYGAMVRKGNAELLQQVNGALEELAADGGYEALLERWFVKKD